MTSLILVRNLLILSLVAVSAVAFCQVPTTNAEIAYAMQRFAGASTLKLTLDGTETVDGRGKTVHVDTSFLAASTTSGSIVGLIEIAEFQNGILTQRTVGDGQTLWIYNAKSKEYMAMPYGALGGDPTIYFAKLSEGITSYVEGFGTYPARFLRDILFRRDTFGSGGATYRTWLPGFTPNLLANIGQIFPDPINPNRQYRPDDTHFFITNANGTKPTKSITFEFEAGTSSTELTTCYFSELNAVGNKQRLVDWQLGFDSAIASFPSTTFQFIPPKNAKAIPLPHNG